MKRHLAEAIVLGVILTALSYVLAIWAGWIETLNYLEVFAVFTSYVCTWLCVRQRRINYPIGAVSTAAYAVLFIQSDLFASALLNLYLTPALLYGWFRWREDAQTRPVTRVRWFWWPVYIAVTLAAYFGAAAISDAMGGALAWTDAVVLTATVLAQFLLDNKKIETWAVWAIVNVFAIITYGTAGLYLVSFQYVLFLINTGIGFWVWRRVMRTQDVLSRALGVDDPVELHDAAVKYRQDRELTFEDVGLPDPGDYLRKKREARDA